MTQSTDQTQPKKTHPFITVLGIFGGAYMRELRSRNTLGYRAKGELANTAIALKKGLDALRDHDPNRDAKLARERVLADERIIKGGGRSVGL